MYKILGADGKEYGPVTADTLRQWVREGRANAQTQVQPVAESGWKSLATVPEFADIFAAAPPQAAPPTMGAPNRASNKVAAGLCGILVGGLGIHKFILGYTNAGIIMLVVSIGGAILGFFTCITFVAAWAMALIGLIEGIIYLTKSDEEFVRTYVVGRKEWF